MILYIIFVFIYLYDIRYLIIWYLYDIDIDIVLIDMRWYYDINMVLSGIVDLSAVLRHSNCPSQIHDCQTASLHRTVVTTVAPSEHLGKQWQSIWARDVCLQLSILHRIPWSGFIFLILRKQNVLTVMLCWSKALTILGGCLLDVDMFFHFPDFPVGTSLSWQERRLGQCRF